MTAIAAQGIQCLRSTDNGLTYNPIGEVISISGPGGNAQVIDVTHLGSSAKEKLIGLPDEGQVGLEVNLDPQDTEQIGLREDRSSQTKRDFKLILTDINATEIQFQAFVLGFAISAQVDQQVTASITLEVTGALQWIEGIGP